MTDIAKQIKKDLFSANRRIARLEEALEDLIYKASGYGDDSLAYEIDSAKELLKGKW